MAICINCDGICFGTYSITPSPAGICIGGVFSHQGTELNPTQAMGSTTGFTAGGRDAPNTRVSKIDSFPFTSDTSATCVGDISCVRDSAASSSSSTHGYTAGGSRLLPTVADTTVIDKFPFAISGGTGTSVGVLTQARSQLAGQTSSSHGYSSGGLLQPTTEYNTIDKYPLSSDTDATDVGDITLARRGVAGQSSLTHGYTSGGFAASIDNTIDKFPFSTDTNATDVGNLVGIRFEATGSNSTTHGYSAGGRSAPATRQSDIYKFSFAADGNATDVSELIDSPTSGAGISSTTHGYNAGGIEGGSSVDTDTIQKYSFSADSAATDVGELTTLRFNIRAGNQV